MKFEAFDTETIDGKAFLIASSKTWKEVKSFEDCIEFLFRSQVKLSFAFNMDYDASAILKFLPVRDLDKLYLHNRISVNGWRIEYLPAKIFFIEGIEMFDLMQFYAMSLENAAQKYLNEGKDDIPHYVKSNLAEYYPLPEWTWKVRNYCVRDASLTYRLAENFLNMLSIAGVETKKYYSTGYLAGKYLNKVKPGKIPLGAAEFIRPSYYGGRNECTMKGFIPKCFVYDINSAYPSVIRTLYSMKGAKFKASSKVDKKATYSFIRAKMKFKRGRFIYPIPWKEKRKGFIFYPRLTGQEVTVTSPEWEVMEKHNVISKVSDIDVVNVYCNEDRPFSFVDDLFAERKKSDAHNYIFKIILNSIYGKFYERRKSYVPMTGKEIWKEDIRAAHKLKYLRNLEYAKSKCSNAWRYYEKVCACGPCQSMRLVAAWTRHHRKKDIDPVVVIDDDGFYQYYKKQEAEARRFNILYATIITSKIRSLIFDAASSVGENFIACFTDSIFSLVPLADKFISDEIGQFSLKGIAENMIMVGTGVYEYDGISKSGAPETFTRFRGFKRSGGLRDIMNTEETEIELSSLQRVTWGTVVQQTKIWNPQDYNKLIQRNRKLHINFDNKRSWDSSFSSGKELLRDCIQSKPLDL